MLVATTLGAFGVVAFVGWRMSAVDASLSGIDEHTPIRAADLANRSVHVAVKGASGRDTVLKLNGQLVTDATIAGNQVSWPLPNISDGHYDFAVRVARGFLLPSWVRHWHFDVDGLAPVITMAPTAPSAPRQPVTITGTLDGPAELSVSSGELHRDDSAFTITLPYAPVDPVVISAVDRAGNTSTQQVVVPVVVPPIHGVHLSALALDNPARMNAVFALIDAKAINTVEIDLKDESGEVGFDSTSALANQIGAVKRYYKLADAISEFHQRSIRVVGRMVAFRDPILAAAAWKAGAHDWVLQTPAGQPLGAYGGFTNYVNDNVRAYNLDIAIEAAKAGIDDILWDYIRRPEGDPASMVVPGLGTHTTAEFVASFLAEGLSRMRPLGVLQGASVFGVAASRPGLIGQDVPTMATHLDYVSPMLYPSHWNKGEYGVADPVRQPYDIVSASLVDFQAAVLTTNAALVPWLQDFDQGAKYGPTEVAAQIKAGADLGVDSWLLWNPSSQYSLPVN